MATEARHDPLRLEPKAYPLRFGLRVLYSDIDANRHINNVSFLRYLEEGRSSVTQYVYGEDLARRESGIQVVFARIMADYLAQGYYPGTVEVATAIVSVGRSSYTVGQAVFQNDTCLILAEGVMVKRIAGMSSPLTVPDRERLEALSLGGVKVQVK